MVLYMIEADFLKKKLCPENGENGPKIGLFILLLLKSHAWEKYSSQDMCQNAPSQSNCRIFNYTF